MKMISKDYKKLGSELLEKMRLLDAEIESNINAFRGMHESWFRPLKTKKYYKLCLDIKKRYLNLQVEGVDYLQELLKLKPDEEKFEIEKSAKVLLERIDNRLKILDAYLNDMLFYTTINNTRFAIIVATVSLIVGLISLTGINIQSILKDGDKSDIVKSEYIICCQVINKKCCYCCEDSTASKDSTTYIIRN